MLWVSFVGRYGVRILDLGVLFLVAAFGTCGGA